MPEIRLTKRDIEKAKKKEGVYQVLRKPEQKPFDPLLMKHAINYLKLIKLVINNETNWLKFKEELRTKLQ